VSTFANLNYCLIFATLKKITLHWAYFAFKKADLLPVSSSQVKKTNMKLSEFKFEIPNNLIALRPAENRDESRLMVLHKDSGKIEHKVFKDVVNYFSEGDIMVGNDTMVFPARLYGRKEKTGAKIEVFLLRELNAEMHLWDVLVDPARKIRVGNKLYFGNGDLVAEVIDNTTSRGRTIRFLFDGDGDAFNKVIETLGETPLPKYIKRKIEPEDKDRFQTIFAKNKGAVSAPTAGLHFTKQLVKRLQIKGIDMSFITLHIGLGTFRQVDVEDLTKHKMDSENFIVGPEVVEKVNKALDNKSRVCAIGTTSMRALESSVSAGNRLKVKEGWTDKFIFPPYDFKICNAMITNFHMPESTLLMMAAAFGGFDLVMEAYKVAKKEKYKFLTYGDAMLII
jgi:S-adenosylmethionine:tRNA ribosyltransferase-isomerase